MFIYNEVPHGMRTCIYRGESECLYVSVCVYIMFQKSVMLSHIFICEIRFSRRSYDL